MLAVSGDSTFDVRLERRHGAVVVVARGELDLRTAEELRNVLGDPNLQADTVVLDLRELTFLDSSGLSVVVGEHQRAAQQGFRFAVAVGGAPTIARLFDLSGLRGTLTLVEDPDAAVGS